MIGKERLARYHDTVKKLLKWRKRERRERQAWIRLMTSELSWRPEKQPCALLLAAPLCHQVPLAPALFLPPQPVGLSQQIGAFRLHSHRDLLHPVPCHQPSLLQPFLRCRGLSCWFLTAYRGTSFTEKWEFKTPMALCNADIQLCDTPEKTLIFPREIPTACPVFITLSWHNSWSQSTPGASSSSLAGRGGNTQLSSISWNHLLEQSSLSKYLIL